VNTYQVDENGPRIFPSAPRTALGRFLDRVLELGGLPAWDPRWPDMGQPRAGKSSAGRKVITGPLIERRIPQRQQELEAGG
jgi:hypothetical protein